MEYSIEELADTTGITIRNIRFYATEKLIPRPKVSKVGARYDENHLLLLKVIKYLHEKKKVRLSGLREALSGMSQEQMLLIASDEIGNTVNAWGVSSSGILPEKHTGPQNFSLSAIGTGRPVLKEMPIPVVEPLLIEPQETWHRLKPVDGIEINIRSDIDPQKRNIIMQLLKQLR